MRIPLTSLILWILALVFFGVAVIMYAFNNQNRVWFWSFLVISILLFIASYFMFIFEYVHLDNKYLTLQQACQDHVQLVEDNALPIHLEI